MLVTLMVVPLGAMIVSLSSGAIELARSVIESQGAKEALIKVAAGGEPASPGGGVGLDALEVPAAIITLAQDYGVQALRVVGGIAGTASKSSSVSSSSSMRCTSFSSTVLAIYQWLEKHSPLSEEHTRRFSAAFHETGRGLFVGVGLTSLAQGTRGDDHVRRTGRPARARAGFSLTCATSLIPTLGTGLVWVPVAIPWSSSLGKRSARSSWRSWASLSSARFLDNFLRPVFSRFGKLELPTFVLLTSLLGGIVAFGPGGLLLGRWLARLAKEALLLARLEQIHRAAGVVALCDARVTRLTSRAARQLRKDAASASRSHALTRWRTSSLNMRAPIPTPTPIPTMTGHPVKRREERERRRDAHPRAPDRRQLSAQTILVRAS